MAVIGNAPSISLNEILFASDFTPASERALEYARAWAKRFGATIIVANVVDLSVATTSDGAVVGLVLDDMREESAENVERAVNELREAGVKAEGRKLEAHNPGKAFVRLAAERGSDLLVVGTHARRGLSKFILGSFAEGVIRHAGCPVLTIGPDVKPISAKGASLVTMLFATDFHHHPAEKAAVALAFAEDSLARIFLCHVFENPDSGTTDALEYRIEAEAALQKLIPTAALEWCDAECDLEYGDPPQRILRLAEETNADLIVLGARRSAAWFTHFTEGVAGKVIEKAKCPVMTICTD